MKKRILTCLTVLTLSMASSMSVLAAPEVMPDGGVFDAEYYAQNNPDVVAVLGTDKNALYDHYVNYGKAEGRLATAPVELTKEDVTTFTAKREQFHDEWQNIYGTVEFYDKVGHEIKLDYDGPKLHNYFKDDVLEQFNNYDELIEYTKTIDLYEYADKVTFANSYYYQELKSALIQYVTSNTGDVVQFHYKSSEYEYSPEEVYTCCMNICRMFNKYVCFGYTTGTHWIKDHPGIMIYGRNYDNYYDGYCVKIGFYATRELAETLYNNWKKDICKQIG